ncbi:MAG: hypothetical protein WCD18_16955, partial [Thermosynechococcaceae cyanobacterium]
LAPLLQAIAVHAIDRARIYRFTRYPTDLLFGWEKSSQAISLSQVLSHCHRDYTFAMIWSDAGAASHTYYQANVDETIAFLGYLWPCVRQVIWLNPLPAERWYQSSAQAIAVALDGDMVALDRDCFKKILKRPLERARAMR